MAAEFPDSPLGTAEADRLFACLDAAHGVGLAVSGGADSVALMHLFAAWRVRRRPGLPALVLTVDHGLRREAAAEAATVAGWAAALGLDHETLEWQDPKPPTGLQEVARQARYRLLSDRCAGLGLTHLVTAHHLDDQAETVLMRLGRGSGIDGLAGMAAHVPLSGPVLTRPLLDVPKSRLVATLRALDHPWLEDPSNEDARFARARLRRLLPLLAEEGITVERLGEFARRAARARAALNAAAAELHRAAVVADPAGFCRVDPAALSRAPEEIGLRVLARLLMGVGGSDRPARQARLERLHAAFAAHARGTRFPGATLGGCRIVAAGTAIAVLREPGRTPPETAPLSPNSSVLWDGRFRVSLATGLDGAVVRPLGPDGLAALRTASTPRPMPAAAARVSPGVFVGGALHAAPQVEAGPGRFSPPGIDIAFVGNARFAAMGG